MAGRMEFDLGFGVRGGAGRTQRRTEGEPFRLLLVGDLSGGDGATAAALKRPLAIDAGDVELAFSRFEVSLPVEVPGAPVERVRFTSLEDFHPDVLWARLAAFRTPRELRAALTSPSPSPETFAAVEAWLGAAAGASTTAGEASDAPAPAVESTDDTLARLLGGGPARPAATTRAGGVVDALLADIVKPHVTPDVSARRTALLAALDEVLSRQLRAVLSEPRFRSLEGTWRGVDRLARALDTDAELSLSLLDAAPGALTAAVPAPGTAVEESALHRLLVTDQPRGWSLVALAGSYGRSREGLSVLAAVAAVASRAGAAVVAGARPAEDAGADPAFWQALRESPLGARIALGYPRVLARLPYGKKTDPVSAFPFEELLPRAGADPAARVWSSAAFALAEGLGLAYRADGWGLDPGAAFELSDLPTHTYDDDGEQRLVPATEVFIDARKAESLQQQGTTPLMTRTDRGSLRCPGVTSVAGGALVGGWTESP